MNRNTWSVARFCFRATFAGRRSGYVALALLIALLGGLAMGSLAAARRTQSSFPQYLASTDPPQLSGTSAEFIPGIFPAGYDPSTISKIEHLGHVTAVSNVVGINTAPITSAGAIKNPVVSLGVTFIGTMGGPQKSVTMVEGRLPATNDLHAFIADQAAVAKLHLHLGAVVNFGVYTNAQTQLPGIGTTAVQPFGRVSAKLVGIFEQPQHLVEDDVDASTGNVAFTPAFTHRYLSCCADFTESNVYVSGGTAAVANVRAEILHIAPPGAPPFSSTSDITAKAERAIRPESIAIGAFGGIVAAATLLVAGQLIGRQLRLGVTEATTMRALGADPAMTAADGLFGAVGAIVIGSILAVVVAVGLSPLAPFGPVRPVYPTPGLSFDWTVLAGGVAVLVVVLGGLSVALASRYSPRRVAVRSERVAQSGPGLASAVSAGLPPPALVGLRFAVEPGRGVDPVPVRSVVLGSVLALIVVISTTIFGSSLNSLVSQPRLYGWNWNYELASEYGSGNIGGVQVTSLLRRDPDVAAWSGAYFDTPKIDGQVVPVLGEQPGAVVAPPTLTGQGLESGQEIVLGAATLASLHKSIGETVTLKSSCPATGDQSGCGPLRLRIVGTATMPTIGQGTSLHLEMGSGALVPTSAIPALFRAGEGGPPGPDAIFIRLKVGVDPAAALPQLRRIAAATGNSDNDGVVLNAVQRPAEIVNYRTLGAIPVILGAALAAGTVVGLGLTLFASVRRRRRDLALLKTLGFTKRQLSAVVASQSSVTVVLGALFGVPLGIVVGRYLWDLFANEIHAVPAPTVSATAIVLITLGALVLANLVALVPGRLAAHTPVATSLQAD